MKLGEITESTVTIPQDWIDKIEKRRDMMVRDFTALDEFIIRYYPRKAIHAISKVTGYAHATVAHRVDLLKQSGRIPE